MLALAYPGGTWLGRQKLNKLEFVRSDIPDLDSSE